MKLRLKQRMYLQFFLAVLPLAMVFSYQMLSTSQLPEKIDRTLSIFKMRLQASSDYKKFLNGVTDAVDTGRLSNNTLLALADTRKNVATFLAATSNPDIAAAAKSLEKVQDAINSENSIGALTPLRTEINFIDIALLITAEELQSQLSALVEVDHQ